MALTKEQSDQLKDYFPVQAHEFLNGNTYISEEAITNRLDEVDPSWSMELMQEYTRDKQCIAVMRLTVCGVSRDGVGMQPTKIMKKDGTEMDGTEPEKSAATDALKRAARLFGIGRYILEMGRSVSDQRSLTDWLTKRRGVNPQTGEIKLVQNGTQPHQEGATGVSSEITTPTTTTPPPTAESAKAALGTPSGQTVAPRAGNFPMGDFKTRVLKEIYAGNTIHMNKSLDKLIKAGVLNYDSMTLEQAYEVVQTRKEVDVA